MGVSLLHHYSLLAWMGTTRVEDQSHCEGSVGNTSANNCFTADAVILAESLVVLALTLQALHVEVMSLGFQVFEAR